MIAKFNRHRVMKQRSIFGKYHKLLLMIGFIFILTLGAFGQVPAHPQEEGFVVNAALFYQDQVAGDTHAPPAHAQLSIFQDYVNGVQVQKDKWLKQLPASIVSREVLCLPLHRQFAGLYPMLFHSQKLSLSILHCCYRI